ncbi:toll/interleukin-1 receptor domain-containing protein [Pseudoxanthomonas sp.]|uniref:toll/interleukin-1 receptor domain-containing protein n=1 Tax=Pseudoxanthomonas sp. TaxID=1871049 RepID=UPI0026191DE4|nr:toll/interleukin-1 receptor domain-containing protein [Pseudoxanthomonas sp.]WDS35239.1 MAG: toll/interleukin-1 receptor domain-containing protein [Pseudoxanthomonas sp.]
MIFISHNYKDKALVEQIALRLKDIFGQENVFYDSWSIQPGDGIIDKMNEGLGACKLFLFFVSKNSLLSNMVKLEWQNAVLQAAKGTSKLIPVKLDDCFMPPILAQNLYIDLYGHGLEVALRQIVDVSEGRNTFQAGPQEFSNLRAYAYEDGASTFIECHAEHYLEPISNFVFLVENKAGELNFVYKSGNTCNAGFNEGVKLDNGMVVNGQLIGVDRGTVPGFPVVVQVIPVGSAKVRLIGVLHEKKAGNWSGIPVVAGRKGA